MRRVMDMLMHSSKRLPRRFVHLCILLLIGIFVSAQQAASESVFDTSVDRALRENKLGAPDFGATVPGGYASASIDTVEVYDIEVYEEDERNIYKEVAVYVLVAAAVGYFVYTLIRPDDDVVVDDGGKEPPIPPSISIEIPLNR
jgi:hypothetical protein